MKKLAAFTLSVGLFASAQAIATESFKAESFQSRLASVPAPEMPAKAADLVKAARSRDRSAVTVEVVKAALARNPAAALSVVGAIAKVVPEMAAVAAGAAAEVRPAQAAEITRAAVSAAPAKAGKIVAAVCLAVPRNYRQIALAAAEVAPGANKEILRAVATVLPSLRVGIDNALARSNSTNPSVAAVLDSLKTAGAVGPLTTARSSSQATGSSPSLPDSLPRGPTLAPPYIPLPAGVTNVNPSTSGPVPRGDRNYAAP